MICDKYELLNQMRQADAVFIDCCLPGYIEVSIEAVKDQIRGLPDLHQYEITVGNNNYLFIERMV